MIHLYGLCYWLLPYAQKALDSLLENASEPLCITVVEGRSKNSDKFLEWGKQCISEGKIERFIAASDNCRGKGLVEAFHQYPPYYSGEDFCIFTDLDLLFPQGYDWIKATREAMKVGSTSGFQLSDENYVPPNYGWNLNERSYGNWVMGIKIEAFRTYPREWSFQDSVVINHALKYGPQVQIQQRVYHMGWDAWKPLPEGDPEYWRLKHENMNWQEANGKYITYTTYDKNNVLKKR